MQGKSKTIFKEVSELRKLLFKETCIVFFVFFSDRWKQCGEVLTTREDGELKGRWSIPLASRTAPVKRKDSEGCLTVVDEANKLVVVEKPFEPANIRWEVSEVVDGVEIGNFINLENRNLTLGADGEIQYVEKACLWRKSVNQDSNDYVYTSVITGSTLSPKMTRQLAEGNLFFCLHLVDALMT